MRAVAFFMRCPPDFSGQWGYLRADGASGAATHSLLLPSRREAGYVAR